MLEAQSLSLVRNGRQLLREVSLSLQPGELLMVLGPNGAGKSSLLKLLSGLWPAQEGSVRIARQAVSDMDSRELAGWRAVLEQHPAAPEGWTGQELAAAGAYHCHADVRRVREAIQQALAATDSKQLAHRKLDKLSGGEKQRLQLARALCQLFLSDRAERYLLLDEPTSALDFAIADTLMAEVGQLCRRHQIGGLAVVHDLNLALRHADKVLLLHEGRSAGFGPRDEIMRQEKLEAVYGIRLAELTHPDASLRAFVPWRGSED
ncbi:ATP-binding cassette domain-containing protein [Chromobacterium sp. IIBBL 290-4]|uniref:ATP-binding cassette domain-containing protein n=1 Tax=Chromobacterium sp. IIBBL 290-4 TaxID=2953890 RepID=UPI0020B8F6C5|nr:ATP-binding cassette domain-containing protein [Chromobacterium sp. IIBBL 290-4]UTH74080.1 ATP-binding cassette domain-containing protein [Chromobacterium sp. IIBBL 290-4]